MRKASIALAGSSKLRLDEVDSNSNGRAYAEKEVNEDISLTKPLPTEKKGRKKSILNLYGMLSYSANDDTASSVDKSAVNVIEQKPPDSSEKNVTEIKSPELPVQRKPFQLWETVDDGSADPTKTGKR